MKKLLLALMLVAFASTVAIAAEGPAEVKFDAKMGTVTFNHAGHQGTVTDCTTCHHKGLEAGTCKSCHGVDPAAPKTKDAYHNLCKGCHDKKGGPTGCKDCHKK
jgi:cytochrome c553